MVTLSKIIERLEMVDDIVDCYYNLHKFKEMAEKKKIEQTEHGVR